MEKMIIGKLSLPLVSFCLLYFLCTSSFAVSLQIASLAQSTLSTMAAGDAQLTTPVQIMHVFVLCSTACVQFIPVRVLLVIWCVLIK